MRPLPIYVELSMTEETRLETATVNDFNELFPFMRSDYIDTLKKTTIAGERAMIWHLGPDTPEESRVYVCTILPEERWTEITPEIEQMFSMMFEKTRTKLTDLDEDHVELKGTEIFYLTIFTIFTAVKESNIKVRLLTQAYIRFMGWASVHDPIYCGADLVCFTSDGSELSIKSFTKAENRKGKMQ